MKDKVKLAMVGMVEGNGHPYSWSAIINGYNPAKMADCPYPVIPEYLGEQPRDEISIAGAEVTHIWADKKRDAEDVAEATYIDNVVNNPEDVIGEVDGVIIPTDNGDNHVSRVKPFIGTGIPIFVDKPLSTNVDDLSQFIKWYKDGHKITSSSAMRYAPAVDSIVKNLDSLGKVRWITNGTHKTWKRYGIHTLEPIARLLGPGFDTVSCTTKEDTKIFTVSHAAGPTISIAVSYDMRGSFSHISLYGTKEGRSFHISDTYTSFRRQLISVIEFIKKDVEPVPFIETIDLMACIIAGQWSFERNDTVSTPEVYASLPVETHLS